MITQPIHVLAKWTVEPHQLDAVMTLAKELLASSVRETGNLFFGIYQDKADPYTLILHEAYADQAAFDFHNSSPHYMGLVVGKIRPVLLKREVMLMTPIA